MSSELALQSQPSAALSFGEPSRFEHMQRVAKMFSDSQLVPPVFQKNIPNCIIAMEMAERMRASPLMVMQNLDIIYNKPTFSSKFLIASANACGRFTPMRFKMVGELNTDSWGCYCVAKSKEDGEECVGPVVTMKIAHAEGWVTRKDSKWKTMPETMLQYRAATWWTRKFAPEVTMGFPTSDEVYDTQLIEAANGSSPEAATATRSRAPKGIAAMKRAGAVTTDDPPPQLPQPPVDNVAAPDTADTADTAGHAPDTPPDTAVDTPADTPPPPEEKPKPAPKPLRCEFVNYLEEQVKKAGGIIGPSTKVQFKGDYEGIAFFNGAKTELPAVGAIADVILTDSSLRGQPVKVLAKFAILA